jgi:VCBS repeat protein
LTAGDFNHDGKTDLAVPNTGDPTNKIGVLLGNGDGTFQPPVEYVIGSGYGYAAATGDLNGDSHLDLVVADALWGGVRRLLGNGDGTFGGAVLYYTSGSCTDVEVADFNADQILDVVTANQGSVSILKGYGNGTFYPPITYGSGPGAFSVAVSDFESDGILDLVTANPNNETVSVFRGNGDGTFQPPQHYLAGPYSCSRPWWVEVGDFNRDVSPDLAVTNSVANTATGYVGTVEFSSTDPKAIRRRTTRLQLPIRAITSLEAYSKRSACSRSRLRIRWTLPLPVSRVASESSPRWGRAISAVPSRWNCWQERTLNVQRRAFRVWNGAPRA